ncbi:MAG: Nif3-like dinuclear metal center hexameric protein [Malacoplasma sp.]|nr:Nif3-like dinuclear metal center hexameric protein [Malacoplasma sp.]
MLKKYPLKFQEEWDESGFRKNGADKTRTVVLTLDPNLEAVELARKNNAHLIISHHPIFIKNKEIEQSIIDKKVIKQLKTYKIGLLSLHTCVDNSPLGINPYILSTLGCKKIKVEKTECGKIFSGNLSSQNTITNVLKKFKQLFNTTRVISLKKNGSKVVKRIYLVCGAGFSVLKNKIENFKPTDLILTGDLKWHDWTLIDQLNVNVVDIAHDVEKCFIGMLEPIIKVKFNKIKILKSKPSIIFNII